jgi:uncharacterized protein YdeI (YjbR/CyaY-like superfamily)
MTVKQQCNRPEWAKAKPIPFRPRFFATPADFRIWLEVHHQTRPELWVGFYTKGSGKPSITWPESVDEALCFGWIDGIRKSLDSLSYIIRFSPRQKKSVWSEINIKRVGVLLAEGRMEAAGLKAFQARRENRSGIYSYEQRRAQLPQPYQEGLQKDKAAWSFFQSQPLSYRKQVSWWVISAKKEETRQKRLQKAMETFARGKRL